MNKKNIFTWAWEQRKNGVPRDEAHLSISEAVKILKEHSDPTITQNKLRDYEADGAVMPERTKGKQRNYSVSNLLSLHLMLQGTKLFGKENTKRIVKFYQISLQQPTRHNPTVFDYDLTLPGEDDICQFLHRPVLESPVWNATQILRIMNKIDTFLHINNFCRKNKIGFKCFEEELQEVKRAGMIIKIAPPLIEWKSVKKALCLNTFFKAEAHLADKEISDDEVNQKIIEWLLDRKFAIQLEESHVILRRRKT